MGASFLRGFARAFSVGGPDDVGDDAVGAEVSESETAQQATDPTAGDTVDLFHGEAILLAQTEEVGEGKEMDVGRVVPFIRKGVGLGHAAF
jgi:hypothetical protein